jgi:glycerophosphoryl diester phosphodiesterase
VPFLYPTDQPRVFAHRGLSIAADGSPIDENTIPAFARALEVGAHYIESDIQVTADGVPVLFHDDDLSRVAGIPSPVGKLTLAELQEIRLEHGGQIPTLVEALREFPSARFNLDFKSVSSTLAGTAAISSIGAQGRVLVASFSDARRLAALNKLPGAATSAGASRVLRAIIGASLRSSILTGIPLTGVHAIQVPTNYGRLRLDTERFISTVAKAGVETHFWTINDPDEMQRLLALGAKGIVTDRADLAIETLAVS